MRDGLVAISLLTQDTEPAATVLGRSSTVRTVIPRGQCSQQVEILNDYFNSGKKGGGVLSTALFCKWITRQ
jgi:hypothetical protein